MSEVENNNENEEFDEEELEELKNDPKIQKLLERETSPLSEEKEKLKKSNNKILSEKKNLQSRLNELYSKVENDEVSDLKESNMSDREKIQNLEKRIQNSKEQLKQKDEEINNLSTKQKNYMIDSELNNKLIAAGVDDKNMLKYAKNGIKNEYNLDLIEDENNNPQFLVENDDLDTFIQRWIQDEGSNFVSKKKTSGGGSRGSQNTSTQKKLTRNNMSRDEKAEFISKHSYEEYANLPYK